MLVVVILVAGCFGRSSSVDPPPASSSGAPAKAVGHYLADVSLKPGDYVLISLDLSRDQISGLELAMDFSYPDPSQEGWIIFLREHYSSWGDVHQPSIPFGSSQFFGKTRDAFDQGQFGLPLSFAEGLLQPPDDRSPYTFVLTTSVTVDLHWDLATGMGETSREAPLAKGDGVRFQEVPPVASLDLAAALDGSFTHASSGTEGFVSVYVVHPGGGRADGVMTAKFSNDAVHNWQRSGWSVTPSTRDMPLAGPTVFLFEAPSGTSHFHMASKANNTETRAFYFDAPVDLLSGSTATTSRARSPASAARGAS
jgi:hypothetical protein